MSATNASKRLGLGLLGALLAVGLLLAACAVPEGRGRAKDQGDLVLRHPGAAAGHTGSSRQARRLEGATATLRLRS
ncbi:hypothetical protein [Streptomyces sp. ISL-94]|uniref:hypothetical protein n=1 Tax=Streptomyces sp. ISL-94 TaxID=2819190 RepID=UPI001BE663D3|nr:hypothetical protein [Streptomyces sp. ISL-94]MBT2481130.1 hypothetical protein [Streptomyces sp. ISL-94]